ncbi:ribonuclease HII [Corynebacterium sp. 13CS0277]|uniref:ribonuclease HII n=1 Tax=Corynebacterium sp. 13CS0277 TaxID=2071994 RepID=UPI000D02627C|nr:ribonuclease HII [Corynebacterium sp. 13CS0277]PRQ12559.1 ribonuclease HII [Corynebacterium sp. 13CS0277]
MRRLKHLRTHEVALMKAGLGPVAGVDEAGRGACAGPLTVAACILPPEPVAALAELTDSKKLTAAARARLYPLVQHHALAYAIVFISPQEIDRLGLTHANIGGMRRAVAALGVEPGYVLTDAMSVGGLRQPFLPMIGGDATVRCIAAASVLAKHSRDVAMGELDEVYPGYGLGGHKGYGTAAHMDAVRRHGGTPIHRYSYANVAAAHSAWRARKESAAGCGITEGDTP